MKTALPLVCLCAAALPAQRVLFQHHGEPNSRLGAVVRPAGDVDGDGVTDFLATQPAENFGARVEVVSGRTGAVLRIVQPIYMRAQNGRLDAVGIGDADGDQRGDYAIATDHETVVYSGATGARLHSRAGGVVSISGVGDIDGDGRPELAVATYGSGDNAILVLDGATGLQHAHVPGLSNPNASATLRSVGDLTGDGREELALGTRDDIYVVDTSPPSVLRTIRSQLRWNLGEYMETADLDGDGKREVLVVRAGTPATTGRDGRVEIYDAERGSIRLAIELPYLDPANFGQAISGVGDLDRDGVGEVVVERKVDAIGGVVVYSGRTGREMWSFAGEPTFLGFGRAIAALGDVDGDGYGDLAIGCPSPYPIAGGWKVLSGRVLADVEDVGGACGGGPFLPELGITRPVIGQNATVVLRDGPSGAVGTLAFGLAPEWPTSFGASTCTVWFDLGSWVALHTTTQSQWSLIVPIPSIPQLAGLELALQCYYVPTSGPLGFDLSNGVHARVGF